MNIEAQDFNIKMNYGELWSLAFDVQSAIKYTLETHWVNHQDVWKHNESERLNKLKSMFLALGRPDLVDNIYTHADETFKKFNDKKFKG